MKKIFLKAVALISVFVMAGAAFAGCVKKETQEEAGSTAFTSATEQPTMETSAELTTEEKENTTAKEVTTAKSVTTTKNAAVTKKVTTTKAVTTTKKAVTTQKATTASAPPAKKLPSFKTEQIEKEIFNLSNDERNAAGSGSLKWSDELHSLACIRAEEASNNFSHTRPSGEKFDSIFKEYNIKYTGVGENLARTNNPDAEYIMGMWMNSEGHKKNILKGAYSKVGIGSYTKNGEIFVVQIFSE